MTILWDLVGFAGFFGVLYLVIRAAVAGGIEDARR
jgi:hypothetical protein